MTKTLSLPSETHSTDSVPVNPENVIVPVRVKNPTLMAALSLLIPGLGQISCAQDNKGVFLMGMALLGYWLTGGIATLILCLLSSLDAFVVGRAVRRGSILRKWDFFPGVKPFEKLPARTIPLIIVLLTFALMTIRIVIFAQGYVTQN
jgi:ABC-type uncharacterized transport system permease subunit